MSDTPKTAQAKLDEAVLEAKAAAKEAEAAASRLKAAADRAAAQEKQQELARNRWVGTLPKTDVAAGDAKAEKGSAGIEATIRASVATSEAAMEIAHSVAGSADGGFILWTARNPPSFENIEKFEFHHDQLKHLFDEAMAAWERYANPPESSNPAENVFQAFNVSRRDVSPASLPLNLAGAALPLAANLSSYFQVDLTYSNAETSGVDSELLARAVSGDLRTMGYKVFDPSFADRSQSAAQLRAMLETLQALDNTAALSLGECEAELEGIDAAIKAAKKDEVEGFATQRKHVVSIKTALERARTRFDELLGSLSEETDGAPGAAKLVNEMSLRALIDHDDRRLLQLQVYANGGNVLVRKGLFNWVPFVKPIRVAGGVVVGFALIGKQGEVLMGDTISVHAGLRGIKEIRGSSTLWRSRVIERRRSSPGLFGLDGES